MADRVKLVPVSSELVDEWGDAWSEPVQVRIVADKDGLLQMEFRKVPKIMEFGFKVTGEECNCE